MWSSQDRFVHHTWGGMIIGAGSEMNLYTAGKQSKVGGRFRSASSISSSRLTLTSFISNPLFSKITAIYINQRNKNGRIYCRERSAGLKQQQAYAEGREGSGVSIQKKPRTVTKKEVL